MLVTPSNLPSPPEKSSSFSKKNSSGSSIDYADYVISGHGGLLAWAKYFLPHHFSAPVAPFHKEVANLARTSNRLAIAAPRAHAKTTELALAYPLYKAACFREPFTLLVSDTATQAEQRTSDLYAELLENTELTRIYPHLALPEARDYQEKRLKRTMKDFITLGGLRFTSAGAGQSLRGIKTGHNRPSLIICDDLENDENVRTPEQRDKLRDWFLKSLSNLPGASGAQLIIIGTILHKHSLLSWLLHSERSRVWTQRLYKAIHDGQPLWPDVWTLEKLEQKRLEITSRAFSSEFLNEPVDESATLYKMAWIEATRLDVAPQLERIVVAIDPSISGEGDECGIVAAGKRGQHGYVLEDNTLQASPAKWARVALETYHRLHADAIVYEKNQGGEMVEQTIKSVLARGEVCPRLIPVHASKGKVARAEPIAALYEKHLIHHIGHLDKLEQELTEWIPGMKSPNRMDAKVWALSELLLNLPRRLATPPSQSFSSVRY